jgi:two-component system, OmpR family, phosphate regulon sensor histidine kinase PhoR
MKRGAMRLFIVLASLSLTGIVVIQIFWIIRAFDLKEKQFNQSITIALKNVAEKILMYNNNPNTTLVNPVQQVSSNYYIVMVNDVIDAYALELYLKTELEHRGILVDFEYGIYDKRNDKMVYGNYVGKDDTYISKYNSRSILPALTRNNYYFGVFFPTKSEYMFWQLDVWIFSSLVLLIVVIFFAYTFFVILKQKRLSEVQTDFINNMTHEFKTPISTIAISSEVLMREDIIAQPQKIYNYARIIHSENARLKNQVERVLQIASLDEANPQLHKTIIDINELLKKVIENMKINLQQKSTQILLSLKEKALEISADSVHLTNIFYNLIDNALKYSPEQSTILIKTKEHKKGAIISIQDNGIGISKEDKKHIFDKFFRVSTGNVHNIKGFGLGLYYVKIMVEAHKGTIDLETEINEGTTFNIWLPYE